MIIIVIIIAMLFTSYFSDVTGVIVLALCVCIHLSVHQGDRSKVKVTRSKNVLTLTFELDQDILSPVLHAEC